MTMQFNCRLCSGPTTHYFNLTVLRKYDVGYNICSVCRSLQTDPPFWLREAYSENIASDDTGAILRNLDNISYVRVFVKLLDISSVLDYGASDGILVRALRDVGVESFGYENYASMKYARSYKHGQTGSPNQYELITAFEVIEHFDNPNIEFENIRMLQPKIFLFSTGIFQGQQSDWGYLAPRSGQHIFFYSMEAIGHIANILNMRFFSIGNYYLGVRHDLLSHFLPRLEVINRLYSTFPTIAIRNLAYSLQTDGLVKDHLCSQNLSREADIGNSPTP